MNAMTMRSAGRFSAAALLCTLFIAGCGEKKALPDRTFASPEEAVTALITAAEQYNVTELKAILGPDGDALVSSGDTILDRNNAVAFAAQARTQQRLEFDSAKTSATLVIGAEDWPTPIPIVKDGSKWYFDAAAGRDEVLRRRIGQNELDAIDVSQRYVVAQYEYALEKHDGALVNQYAQRVISSPGKRDGLAWQAADSTWQGPMGEDLVRAIAEGYSQRTSPYHGYYFKILKSQGPAAPLGEMDFLVDGAMLGGFALAGAPAEYGVTGIQTFIVGSNGIIYQKDLGEKSLEAFRAMDRYNPDSTWQVVEIP